MPRNARIVALGFPHHVTQRGNNKQRIFSDNNDRLKYFSLIQHYSTLHNLSIFAYCLMENHVHFIVTPNRKDSLSNTFHNVHTIYSHYFNNKTNLTGHLFQAHFYSCPLDEFHLIAALRYVERNPVRANLTLKPWDWEWSSASFHIGKNHSCLKLCDIFQIIKMTHDSWKKFIDIPEDDDELENLRKNTFSGKPVGGQEFLEELEIKLGKKINRLPRGRPRKKMESAPIIPL